MAHAEESMTLESYLHKMKANNLGYQASQISQISADQQSYTADLITSPQIIASANTMDDKSPTTNPIQNGTERKTSDFQTGLEIKTDLGLSGKVYIGETILKASGTNPQYVSPDLTSGILQYYGTEIEIPFLKNGFGRDVEFEKEAIKKSSDASIAYAHFDQLQYENKARLLYLTAARLQESINLQKTSLAQGKTLVNWVQERVHTKILESTDLSQAIASMQERDLNLQASLLALADAQKDLNTFIGRDPSTPLPKLQLLDELVPNKEIKPSELFIRSDVKALSKLIDSQRNQLLAQKEDFKAELNLVGKAVGYTKQSNVNDTARCTSFQECSQFYVGITFKMPLNFGAIDNSLESVETKIREKELNLEDSQKQSYSDVQKLFHKSRLLKMQRDLSNKIIETQKLRLSQERKRQVYGRASAFDIIRAEQDYVVSQLNLLSIIYSQAEINANFKLFEVMK